MDEPIVKVIKMINNVQIDYKTFDRTDFRTPIDKLLYLCLYRFTGCNEPTKETLAKMVGVQIEDVEESLERLERAGFISFVVGAVELRG